MTDLSVVVVTWNSQAVIEGCVRSLQETLPEGSWDLIVVDNASTDATTTKVRQLAPQARVIANTSNRGLAAANNQGLAEARAEHILICNPDVVFRPGAVAAMVDLLRRRPGAGWVVPRLIYEDGDLQTSAGEIPTLMETLLGRQVSRRRGAGTTAGFWWDGWAHDEERVIGRGHEAAYVVRAEAVRQVGLQDERFVLDWEGTDWADRFNRAGWEIWLSPEATVVHLGGTSIRTVPLRWAVSQHRGMYYYFADRRPFVWKPALAAAFSARCAIKVVLLAARVPMYQWAHRDRRRSVGRPSKQHGAPAQRPAEHDDDYPRVSHEPQRD